MGETGCRDAESTIIRLVMNALVNVVSRAKFRLEVRL